MTRLLHASGVSLDELGVGEGPLPEPQARQAWRLLCANWHVFRGTPVRYWFDTELGEIFGVTQRPSADNADAIYDQISAKLAEDAFRPRALLSRFGIEVLATTDDPADDLAAHAALAADPTFPTRVIPTFRPDRYLEPARPGWVDAVKGLGAAAQRRRRGLRRVHRGAGGAPPVLHRPRRHLGRPQPPRRQRRAAGAGRGATHLLARR